MIQSFFADNPIWAWWILGIVMIGIEVIAPGTFFLWFGLAALLVGLISLVLGPESGIWGWQIQLIAFVVLALVMAIVGRMVMSRKDWDKSEQPDLNEREAQLIGRSAVVTQAISGGVGRAKIGDSSWRVQGPDLEEGASVKVISAEGGTLIVEAA